MASIGDLFFSLRADDKQLQVDVNKAGDRAGQSFGARMAAGIKKSWSGGEIGKGLVQGLGLAGGLGAAHLVAKTISTITDIVGDSIKAFNEDQASIQKLGTALRANIPNWDGNTAAIERVLTARMKLGFSDDEQRASLALLVAATHDVNKALEIERTAMDLARFKRISLADATEALTKVEAGSYRILKSLGIVLKDGATQTDALAAVQAVAAGQAEDFAQTNEGKLLVSQVKVNEALEKLGGVLAGPVAEGAVGAADALQLVLDVLGGFPSQSDAIGDSIKGLIDTRNLAGLKVAKAALEDALDPLRHPEIGFNSAFINEMRGHLATVNGAITDFADHASRDLDHFQTSASGSFFDVGAAQDRMTATIRDGVARIKTYVAGLATALAADARKMISDYFDPIIAADDLLVQKDAVAAATRERNATKAGSAERHQAQLTLDQSRAALAQTRLNLLEAGQLGAKDQKEWLAQLAKDYKRETGDAKKRTGELIAKIHELQRVQGGGVTITVKAIPHQVGGKMAAGGPVQAGVPYLVGERGPEIVVPRVPATVLTAAQSVGAMAGGVGGVTNIAVQLPTTARPDPFEVADALRWLADFGVLRP